MQTTTTTEMEEAKKKWQKNQNETIKWIEPYEQIK